ANLAVPFSYKGDSLFTLLWIKGIIKNGWYLHNESLGAPFASDLHDFPMADNFNFLLLKIISSFSANPAVVFNVYFLSTFPLVTLAALCVLRHFGISDAGAVGSSLLYTFLPYHVLRCWNGHLFLASYFLVPLAIMLALWIAVPDAGTGGADDGRAAPKRGISRRQLLGSMVLCLLLSSAGIYYAFFAAFLILCAGLLAFGRERSLRAVGVPVLLTSVIAAGALVNIAPNILYCREHGPNPAALQRDPSGPEIYGMK